MKAMVDMAATSGAGSGSASGSGAARRPAAKGRTEAKPRKSTPKSGLSPTQLLDKINALDWDATDSAATVLVEERSGPVTASDTSGTAWRWIAIVAIAIALVAIAYGVLMKSEPRVGLNERSAPIVSAAPKVESLPEPPSEPRAEPASQLPAADESSPPATIDVSAGEPVADPVLVESQSVATVTPTDEEMARQKRAEKRRKALEARKAAEQQARLQAQQAQAAREAAQRRVAEQQAAEAAARAAQEKALAAAKAAQTPKELCASEGNFFARGLCEARLCGKPEWRNHPFCVKRINDQLRSLNQGN